MDLKEGKHDREWVFNFPSLRFFLNKINMIRGYTALLRRPFFGMPKMDFSKKLGIGEASSVLEDKIKNISQLVWGLN